jgi:hypothetical protein
MTKSINLRRLKREFLNELKGHNDKKRCILAKAMSAVVEMRSDPSALNSFLLLAKAERPKSKKAGTSNHWITKLVVTYVTNAKSEQAQKIAWKYVRVLEHLYDFHKVPIEDIPGEIRKRAGIEAVVNLAAKENPLRQKSAKAANTVHGTKKTIHPPATGKLGFDEGRGGAKAISAAASSADDWDDEPEHNPSHSSPTRPDNMVVRISDTLTAKISGIPVGGRLKLIGRRTDPWGEDPPFEVEKVVLMRPAPKLRWGRKPKLRWGPKPNGTK